MRKMQLFATAFLAMSAVSCQSVQEKELTLTVSNSWEEAKQNEPIVLNLEEVNPGFNVQSVVVKEGTTEIPSQLDDLNGDGINDEVAFLLDMPAKSKRDITVSLSAEKSDKTYPCSRKHQTMGRYGPWK